jgi:hypothetical protein
LKVDDAGLAGVTGFACGDSLQLCLRMTDEAFVISIRTRALCYVGTSVQTGEGHILPSHSGTCLCLAHRTPASADRCIHHNSGHCPGERSRVHRQHSSPLCRSYFHPGKSDTGHRNQQGDSSHSWQIDAANRPWRALGDSGNQRFSCSFRSGGNWDQARFWCGPRSVLFIGSRHHSKSHCPLAEWNST